ncbi:hypothetical protein [Streptomyces sp. NPDC007904]|uniref:hypothetical protein n=1 Tax=Streptomyces sp. NPDC007904 TaxID=3364787 RepID=UPI0036EE7866
MTETISQNTALTLAVVDRAVSPRGDLGSYKTIEEILATRDIDQLRELALAAIWQLGTTLYSHAPNTVAALPYPNPFDAHTALTVALSTKPSTPEGH